jgi:AcrR family transcriptional regulator
MRADAERNRARVLDVAAELFASQGLSVPVRDIARRAGVGTGTVSRHFPTKDALFTAIVLSRIERLIERGESLRATTKPGKAFFEFFGYMVTEGATNLGVGAALAGSGFDVQAVASGAQNDLMGMLAALLKDAQMAGAVRRDVDVADIKALIGGCIARQRQASDAAARDRVVTVVCDGLRMRRR